MAFSTNLESEAGKGGSWKICKGFEPSFSSILIVTLWTDAVPVFLPRICWLKRKNIQFFSTTPVNFWDEIEAIHCVSEPEARTWQALTVCGGNTLILGRQLFCNQTQYLIYCIQKKPKTSPQKNPQTKKKTQTQNLKIKHMHTNK